MPGGTIAQDPSSSTRQENTQTGGGGGGSFGGGGAGGGASYGPSNTATPGRPKASQGLPSGIVHWSTKVTILATNVPQPLPGYAVPSNCNVRLRAPGGNAQTAYYANYREKLLSGNGVPLAPLDDVLEQAPNLSNIWVMGTQGDALAVSVQTQPV